MNTTNVNTDDRTFTPALTTDLPKHSDNGVSITIVVIVTVSLTILLLSCGGFVYYIIKRRRNIKSINYKQGIGKGAENRSFSGDLGRISGLSATQDTSSTRESGAYKSYDAITVDLKHIEKRHDLSKETLASERQSKESSKSGAYMSFDDIEHVVPDMRNPVDDFTGITTRMSNYCDFIVPEETVSDTENRHTDRRSFHNQLTGSRPNSRINVGKTKMKGFRKSIGSEIPEHTDLAVYNPAFLQIEQTEPADKTSISSTTEKTVSGN